MQNFAHDGADKLYLLTWQDTLERLDTLILEIRNLRLKAILHPKGSM